jgi:hypothetical protein
LWADQIFTYADQIYREAGFRKCISPAENLEFGKRWLAIGQKMARRKEGVSGGLKTNMALISAT